MKCVGVAGRIDFLGRAVGVFCQVVGNACYLHHAGAVGGAVHDWPPVAMRSSIHLVIEESLQQTALRLNFKGRGNAGGVRPSISYTELLESETRAKTSGSFIRRSGVDWVGFVWFVMAFLVVEKPKLPVYASLE